MIVGGPINTTGLPSEWRRVLTMLQADMYLRDAPDLSLCFSLKIVRLWSRARSRTATIWPCAASSCSARPQRCSWRTSTP